MKPRVYVAGPYTEGDVAVNVANAIFAADVLLQEGLVPFVPHLYHFWHMLHPHHYETWMELDAAWLPATDAIVVLPGESLGALQEVVWATRLGIPIYYAAEPLYDSLAKVAGLIMSRSPG